MIEVITMDEQPVKIKRANGKDTAHAILIAAKDLFLKSGFSAVSISDIAITLDASILNIKSDGKKYPTNEVYLYKGIAYRAFEKKFRLADNIRISGAFLNNGLLDIDLIKVTPAKSKPEEINILSSRPLSKN